MFTAEKIPLASDFMRTKVHTISPEMPLDEIIQFLLKHEISNAPVVERQAEGHPRLVGFISERDCLSGLTQESFFGSPRRSRPQPPSCESTRFALPRIRSYLRWLPFSSVMTTGTCQSLVAMNCWVLLVVAKCCERQRSTTARWLGRAPPSTSPRPPPHHEPSLSRFAVKYRLE
jgi:hypothetical protein